MRRLALHFVLFPLALAACSQGYSPNTYASNAAQEEATVQRGVIIGVRQVMISADGTIGAATGAAVGGAAGSQVVGAPVVSALGAIGGSLVGGLTGEAAAHAVADTKGWEYIVQEDGSKLVSVTQTSKTALPIGLHVLVIAGTQQARIVPDYTVQVAATPGASASVSYPANGAASPNGLTTAEIRLGPLPPAANPPVDFQAPPIAVAPNPATPQPAAAADPAAPPAAKSAAGTGGSPAAGGSTAQPTAPPAKPASTD